MSPQPLDELRAADDDARLRPAEELVAREADEIGARGEARRDGGLVAELADRARAEIVDERQPGSPRDARELGQGRLLREPDNPEIGLMDAEEQCRLRARSRARSRPHGCGSSSRPRRAARRSAPARRGSGSRRRSRSARRARRGPRGPPRAPPARAAPPPRSCSRRAPPRAPVIAGAGSARDAPGASPACRSRGRARGSSSPPRPRRRARAPPPRAARARGSCGSTTPVALITRRSWAPRAEATSASAALDGSPGSSPARIALARALERRPDCASASSRGTSARRGSASARSTEGSVPERGHGQV